MKSHKRELRNADAKEKITADSFDRLVSEIRAHTEAIRPKPPPLRMRMALQIQSPLLNVKVTTVTECPDVQKLSTLIKPWMPSAIAALLAVLSRL